MSEPGVNLNDVLNNINAHTEVNIAMRAYQRELYSTPLEEQLTKYLNVTPPPREIQLHNIILEALEKNLVRNNINFKEYLTFNIVNFTT